jgi:NADPH-dependent 2,4-dienoyl-CoA reductase/sulfur reductase-like enzyme
MAPSRSELSYDVVIVGAGPAGLAAATRAMAMGASVALVDAGSAPGGQYWRHPAPNVNGVRPVDVAYHHHHLETYRTLVSRLEPLEEAGTYLREHHVWTVASTDGGFVVHAVDRSGGAERLVEVLGRRLVLAPGAFDRQLPFPGWDLPGVMTAGGAQALLKGHDVSPGRRVVVAGTGPFLLPVAAGLAQAGATVVGVHEAASPSRWLKELRVVGRNLGKLGEGFGYATTLIAKGVPVRTRSTVIAAHGDRALEAVTIARVDGAGNVSPGSAEMVGADTLAVGWGFTPQLELPLALGCRTRPDVDGSPICVVDDMQQSSVPGVYIAGEASGVGGAALAVVEGVIAGAAAAGAPTSDRRLLRQRSTLRAFAGAVQRAHPVPSGWVKRLDDRTVVCRCEEVSYARLRDVVERLAVGDARTAKLVARPGMGWCQGRICGYATACVIADLDGKPRSSTGTAERPVASPITLGALAAEDAASQEAAHDR